MAVISDIIEGDITDDENGVRQTRVFLVNKVSGSPERRMWNALRTGGIPRRDKPHPFISGIRVLSVSASPASRDNTVFKVSVLYGRPQLGEGGVEETGGGEWSFSAELVTETTQRDIDGRQMKTQFANFTTLVTRVHEVEVDRPLFTARCRRTESKLDSQKQIDFSGKINRSRWSNFPAATWLCRINAEPNNKNTFDYEYIFHYRPETWVADVTSKIDGEIPLGVVLGNGREVYDVYERQDFNKLGLVIPR